MKLSIPISILYDLPLLEARVDGFLERLEKTGPFLNELSGEVPGDGGLAERAGVDVK